MPIPAFRGRCAKATAAGDCLLGGGRDRLASVRGGAASNRIGSVHGLGTGYQVNGRDACRVSITYACSAEHGGMPPLCSAGRANGLVKLVRPVGIEPTTLGLEVPCSIR